MNGCENHNQNEIVKPESLMHEKHMSTELHICPFRNSRDHLDNAHC